MSLFGSSPRDSSLPTRAAQSEHKSLFDETQAPGAASNASLFDDNADSGPSPWSLPNPKKAGRSDLVKTLLPASQVPESYIDAYDILLESGYKTTSGSISVSGAKRIFEGGGLPAAEQVRILNLVTGEQDFQGGLSRNEFNVLLALTGLSQESEEPTLDGVDERRKSNQHRSFSFTISCRVVLTMYRSSRTIITIRETTTDCKSLGQPRRRLSAATSSLFSVYQTNPLIFVT